LSHSLLISCFFSSRRRHTRFSRDWSSDVCSSDLGVEIAAFVSQVGPVKVQKSYTELDLREAENNAVRCADPDVAQEMFDYLDGEIGRASCRERGYIAVVAVALNWLQCLEVGMPVI